MGVYEGYQKFRKAGGTIKFAELEPGTCAMVNPETCEIELDRDYPLEEQVKSLIHEFLHLCKKYGRFLYVSAYHYVETAIEKETPGVYFNQPNLANHLRKKVLDLRKTQKREPVKPACNLRNMHSFEKDRPLLRDPVYKKLSTLCRGAFKEIEFGVLRSFLEDHISSLAERTMHKEDYEFFNTASMHEIENHVFMESIREDQIPEEQYARVQEDSGCDLF